MAEILLFCQRFSFPYPHSELNAAMRVDTVAAGDNHAEVEGLDAMNIVFPVHGTIWSGCRKICNSNHLIIQFTVLKYILDMS